MLELYRFNNADLEDVKLQDRAKTEVYDEGQWLTPLGNAAQEWTMSASATVNTDVATNLSKMIFMEKGRSDSRVVGKMSVVSGAGVRGKTDMFLAADAASMAVGKPLTLKKDADDVVKFAVADPATDMIKAFCFLPPGADPKGLLHFELIR